MPTYPHRIRLRGPWECEPLAPPGPARRVLMPCRWADVGLAGPTRVRCRRRFGYPGRIDSHERVWLTLAGAEDRVEVWVNEEPLGQHPGDRPCELEVTALLRARNELAIAVESAPGSGGLWGEVALEVRCSAFLRDVYLQMEGPTLLVCGAVVGTAEGELELYAVCDRHPAGYAKVVPSPEGAPFALRVEGQGAQPVSVQVDLVNRATVWYTVIRELSATGACDRVG